MDSKDVVGSRGGLRTTDVVKWHVVGSYWDCSERATVCSGVVCFFGCTVFLLLGLSFLRQMSCLCW